MVTQRYHAQSSGRGSVIAKVTKAKPTHVARHLNVIILPHTRNSPDVNVSFYA